jgi:integrase
MIDPTPLFLENRGWGPWHAEKRAGWYSAAVHAADTLRSLRRLPRTKAVRCLGHSCHGRSTVPRSMHLLQSGVDIAVIALWLGHESIETTHGYLEADLKLKEKALQKLAPAGQAAPRFQADDPLLGFLKKL